ncbi:MAG: hypothetical protein AAB581_02840, partial [Patescibacteria group bacterium]
MKTFGFCRELAKRSLNGSYAGVLEDAANRNELDAIARKFHGRIFSQDANLSLKRALQQYCLAQLPSEGWYETVIQWLGDHIDRVSLPYDDFFYHWNRMVTPNNAILPVLTAVKEKHKVCGVFYVGHDHWLKILQ